MRITNDLSVLFEYDIYTVCMAIKQMQIDNNIIPNLHTIDRASILIKLKTLFFNSGNHLGKLKIEYCEDQYNIAEKLFPELKD